MMWVLMISGFVFCVYCIVLGRKSLDDWQRGISECEKDDTFGRIMEAWVGAMLYALGYVYAFCFAIAILASIVAALKH